MPMNLMTKVGEMNKFLEKHIMKTASRRNIYLNNSVSVKEAVSTFKNFVMEKIWAQMLSLVNFNK